MKKTALVWAGAILLGLFLGGAIRRARAAAAPEAVEVALPAADRVDAARVRGEIRDLDRRLGALKEEEDRLERERARLSEATAVEAAPTPQEFLRAQFRSMLEKGEIAVGSLVNEWIRADPANIAVLMRIAVEVLREKDRGPRARKTLGDSVLFMTNDLMRSPRKAAFAEWVAEAQAREADPVVRGWMLFLLDHWKVALSKERTAELARGLAEMTDPTLRAGAFTALARNPEGHQDALREVIRAAGDGRSESILKAWELKALPAGELRTMVRDVMRSDAPGEMIEAAESWVPKYLNPFAPQETVGLFHQTLSKPIAPYQKAVSMMVMSSLSTVFPAKPGRAELAAFAAATQDEGLKKFAGALVEMIDQGKTYDDIRKLDPSEFGIPYPR